MAEQIKLTIEGDRARLVAPFHPDFPSRARRIGGVWKDSLWTFDARDVDRVHDLCARTWGVTPGGPSPRLVSMIVPMAGHSGRREAWGFGRLIAARKERDWKVRLGPGVSVVSGAFADSGGSRANPTIGGADVILRVRDVPIALAEAGDWIGATIETAPADDRTRILARLDVLASDIARLVDERATLRAALDAIEDSIEGNPEPDPSGGPPPALGEGEGEDGVVEGSSRCKASLPLATPGRSVPCGLRAGHAGNHKGNGMCWND